MKILILDIYKDVEYRISKDTSGGYGTGNNFGDGFFTKILKKKFKKEHDWPPLFIAYTYSVLKKQNHIVKYSRYIPENFSDFDFYILSSSIVCCESEIEAIKKLRKETQKKIFVVGPFATNNPEKYIEAGSVVISGEPEFYFMKNEYLNLIDNDKIIRFNHDFEIDDLPIPNWDEIIDNFEGVSNLFGKFKNIPILATRGCPYSCFKYCVYPLQQGRKVRQRSPQFIVDEMETWVNKGIKMFTFRDPVFSINRKHTIEFCKQVIEQKLNITFMVETHLNNLDDEMIPLLRKAGLELVYVGVESSSHFVLKDMKRFTVEHDKQFQVIKKCEDSGIKVKTMFIIGNPEDTKDTIIQSIEYAKYLPSLYSQFSVFTPYPGTPAYNEFKDIITETKLENFNQYNLTFKHKNLTKNNISDLKSLAYFKFYLNFNKVIQILKYFIKSKYEKADQRLG